MSLKQNVVKPMCGRCGQPVDESFAEPISDGEDGIVSGYRVFAKCHGETHYDNFTVAWFLRRTEESKPFFDSVFKPAEVKPITAIDVAKDSFIVKLRSENLAMRKKMQECLLDVAKSFGHETVFDLLKNESVIVQAPIIDLIGLDSDPAIQYSVLVNKKVVGYFGVQGYPDIQHASWSAK